MDVEKNGGRLFRRPKLTLSCSAEGREVRREGMPILRYFSIFFWRDKKP
jgi:hypothetical protein